MKFRGLRRSERSERRSRPRFAAPARSERYTMEKIGKRVFILLRTVPSLQLENCVVGVFSKRDDAIVTALQMPSLSGSWTPSGNGDYRWLDGELSIEVQEYGINTKPAYMRK